MKRLFHAIVVAGCALPASCAREADEPAPVDSGSPEIALPDTDQVPGARDVSSPEDTEAMQDAADAPHPHITK
jgi:hypothetical protein